MNSNTKQSSLTARAKQIGAGAVATLASGAAMAQSAAFSPSTIIDKIVSNGAEAVLIVGSFIVAVWALKSMGLFKRG